MGAVTRDGGVMEDEDVGPILETDAFISANHSSEPQHKSPRRHFALHLLTAVLGASLGTLATALLGDLVHMPAPSLSPPSASPVSVFSNYSVPAEYAARWPVPVDSMRGVVVSLWAGTSGDLWSEFINLWPSREQHFFVPMRDHCDHIIFYTVWPTNSHKAVMDAGAALGWKSLHGENRTVIPAVQKRGNFTLESEGDEFLTVGGVHVLLFPIIMTFPYWLTVDAGLLEQDDWHRCVGMKWSLDYELYSGTIFIHRILSHPILSGYDYYIKLDLDVRFNKPIPMSPFLVMQQHQCVWLHSKFIDYSVFHDEDCAKGAYEAAMAWAESTGHVAISKDTQFFHHQNGYYYGNFIGGWLGYLRAPQNLHLMHYLENSPQHPGYFRHRWGDQPPYSSMLGMWYNLSDEEATGVHETQAVCDLTSWRTTLVFEHV